MKIDVTPTEYTNIVVERQEKTIKELAIFISGRLLSNKLDVDEIPLSILLSNSRIYLTVFRLCRNNCKKAMNVLELIIEDYDNITNNPSNITFIERFFEFFSEIDQEFSQIEDYELFRKTIPRKILQKLQL